MSRLSQGVFDSVASGYEVVAAGGIQMIPSQNDRCSMGYNVLNTKACRSC